MSLLVDGLPPNSPDTTYVLWGRLGIEVRAVGVFDATGKGLEVRDDLTLPGDSSQLGDLMVTRERGRTAPLLPGSPVLASGRV